MTYALVVLAPIILVALALALIVGINSIREARAHDASMAAINDAWLIHYANGGK